MRRLARSSRACRRALLLAPLCLLGCGDGEPDRGEPPPAGVPWLAFEYAVEVELVAADCALVGFEPAALLGDSVVFQDGARVRWTQTPTEGGGLWRLRGAVCPGEDGAQTVRLRGGRLSRVRQSDFSCEVLARMPSDAPTDLLGTRASCADDDPAVELEMDACGALEGVFDLALDFGRGAGIGQCVHDEPCVVRLRWRATPTRLDPAAPEDMARPPAAEGLDCGVSEG